ncbi:hypothetical protein [Nocardioides dongkuii]|uniref:hypothetical protein n=1 Tax=Nocardioides dongkuii TaxID=2760089 RepID=UPI001D0CCC06|nr:hypothetical protein [Nocardioides dongkuii]
MSALAERAGRLTSTGIVLALLVLSLVVGFVLTAVEGRNFLSSGNISALLTGVSILGFIATGQTLVILVGSLDLSVPYVVSLVSVLAAGTMAGEDANVLRRSPTRSSSPPPSAWSTARSSPTSASTGSSPPWAPAW